MMKKCSMYIAALLAALVVCLAMGGCSSLLPQESPLDPDNPVLLRFSVTDENGALGELRALTDSFNAEYGAKRGVQVELVEAVDLPEAATAAASAGYELFLADSQSLAENAGSMSLMSLGGIISDTAINGFETAFVGAGKLFGGDESFMYPLMADSDMVFLNHTDWLSFMQGIQGKGYIYVILDNLDDWDGITRICNTYYKWTDDLTPDIPNDGKPFMGFVSAGETVRILMRQRGFNLIAMNGEDAGINLSASDIKLLWDYFYSNYIRGYFTVPVDVNESIVSGETLCYIGGSEYAAHFPGKSIGNEGEMHDIGLFVNQYPFYQTGYPYASSRVIGVAVNTSDDTVAYAAGTYLEWLSGETQALRLAEATAFVPAKKGVVRGNGLERRCDELRGAGSICGEILNQGSFQTIQYDLSGLPAAKGAQGLLDKFSALLINECEARRAEAVRRISAGEDAITVYDELESIDVFESWYQGVRQTFEGSIL